MIFLIDQDQVLAHFELGLYNSVVKNYGISKSIHPDNRKGFYASKQYRNQVGLDIDHLLIEKGFLYNLDDIDGAIDGIKKLANKHEVFICTSPMTEHPSCLQEKYDWIKDKIGKEFCKKLITTKDKTIVYGDYLIDDKVDIKGIGEKRWQHLLFESPVNINDAPHMEKVTWKEIVEKFC
ncbi:MAG: hypothetical protein LC122_02560 [Chitinophagales bacterium]|nr:hypothetical protein [Chitinophagales bacterium]